MKRGTCRHPKTKALARTLKIPTAHASGLLGTLWENASDFCHHGGVGVWSDEEISENCGWPPKKAKQLIDALVLNRWLDRRDDCRLFIHDWPDHCEDTVHRKLARAKELFADGTIPKLTRLTTQEHAEVDKYYESRAQDSAQSAPEVRTPCAQSAPRAGQGKARQGSGVAVGEEKVQEGKGVVVVDALPTNPDAFEFFWQLFVVAGVPLNDSDKYRCLQRWDTIPESEHEEIIRWVVKMLKTQWREPQYTKSPLNALESRGWTRKAGPRIIPQQDPKMDEAEEILNSRMKGAAL